MFATVSIQKVLILAAGIAILAGHGESARAQLDDSGQYTDRIVLKNGDAITGNMKGLDRGKLRFKTLTMDTVFINWVDIESIDSDKYLRIEQTDGTFNYGVVQKADLSAELVIKDHGQEVEVPILAVSALQPIRVKQSFWRRLEGDLSAGIDFRTASDDILLISLSSNLRFREEKYELGFVANWNETSHTENSNSSRADIGGTYTKFLRNRWFWQGLAGLERNEELGLNKRILAGATAGKYLIRSPTLRLELSAGLVENWEDRQDGTSQSVEGLISSSLEIYNYTLPVTRLSARINLFPGITEPERLRVGVNISLRNEVVRSVFWDLTFFSNYDNRPPETASEEDYGIVTSIGASF